jgi:chromate transporter
LFNEEVTGLSEQAENKGKILLKLFLAFMKISPVTFGGGYAMIPLIEREVVEERKWLPSKEMPDMLALAGSAPGAIGVNTAIFIGYRIAGLPGSICALTGVMIPTFIIVVLLTVILLNFSDNPWVIAAFRGIAPAVVALILYAGYRIGKTAIIDKLTLIVAALSLLALLFLPVNPIMLILVGGVLSYVYTQAKLAWMRKATAKKSRSNSVSG